MNDLSVGMGGGGIRTLTYFRVKYATSIGGCLSMEILEDNSKQNNNKKFVNKRVKRNFSLLNTYCFKNDSTEHRRFCFKNILNF